MEFRLFLFLLIGIVFVLCHIMMMLKLLHRTLRKNLLFYLLRIGRLHVCFVYGMWGTPSHLEGPYI